ncbi:domain containing protein, putative [Babesia ovata]|uniref:Domain containing protein, putative n=1 Tax=Babesia ovata TaxID=189622 RepID=A0A2H6KF19_9APIC|nr:domain containing protein, putative [Babesia ovata]GBE61577.1 domain containing protein, putative [Babesia ovata]
MGNGKLYEILGVESDASTRDIVKAYRIAALKTHPDKLAGLSEEEREKAAASFVQLQHAYEILKDEERRKQYDDFGWEGEEQAAFAAAYEYYKGPISSEDIDDFCATYKHSTAEEEDLLEFYKKCVLPRHTPLTIHRHDGNITDILSYIPLSESSDLDRFVKFYQEKIESKASCHLAWLHAFQDLESTKRFTKTSSAKSIKEIKQKYKKSMQRESKRAKSSGSFEDLTAQISANRKKRQNDFTSLIGDLEKKYGAKLTSNFLAAYAISIHGSSLALQGRVRGSILGATGLLPNPPLILFSNSVAVTGLKLGFSNNGWFDTLDAAGIMDTGFAGADPVPPAADDCPNPSDAVFDCVFGCPNEIVLAVNALLALLTDEPNPEEVNPVTLLCWPKPLLVKAPPDETPALPNADPKLVDPKLVFMAFAPEPNPAGAIFVDPKAAGGSMADVAPKPPVSIIPVTGAPPEITGEITV